MKLLISYLGYKDIWISIDSDIHSQFIQVISLGLRSTKRDIDEGHLPTLISKSKIYISTT